MVIDHQCPGCGHSLVGQQIGSRCTECALLIVPGGGIMRPRELFIVGIRLIGLWQLAGAAFWIADIINRLRISMSVRAGEAFSQDGLRMLAYLAVGAYFLFGAPHLVALTYGSRSEPQAPAPDPGRSDKAPS